MGTAPPEGFFGYLCARRLIIDVLHAFLWLALVLNTASLLVVTNSPATSVVIGFNYVGIVVMLIISGYMAVKCRRLADPDR